MRALVPWPSVAFAASGISRGLKIQGPRVLVARFWRDGLWQFAPLLLGETHTGFHASEVLGSALEA